MTAPKPLTAWQKTLPESLPRHIRRNIVAGNDGCWIWSRSRSVDGYGWASLENRTHQAHRLVYRLLCGEPKPGLVLDHLCRVRHCVNPAHMEPVTPRQNLERSNLTPAGMDRCKLGHEFAHNGWQRRCPICSADYEASRADEKRAYLRQYRLDRGAER